MQWDDHHRAPRPPAPDGPRRDSARRSPRSPQRALPPGGGPTVGRRARPAGARGRSRPRDRRRRAQRSSLTGAATRVRGGAWFLSNWPACGPVQRSNYLVGPCGVPKRNISTARTRRLTSWGGTGSSSLANIPLMCFSTARLVSSESAAMAALLSRRHVREDLELARAQGVRAAPLGRCSDWTRTSTTFGVDDRAALRDCQDRVGELRRARTAGP